MGRFLPWVSAPVRIRTIAAVQPVEKGAALAAEEPPAPATTTEQQNSAFVTPQSLATFSGLTAAITGIWAGLEAVFGLGHHLWLGFIISLGVGLVLLLDDLRDPQRAATPRTGLRVLIAVVNAFFIFNAAAGGYNLGVTAMGSGTPAAGTAAPAQPASTPAGSGR